MRTDAVIDSVLTDAAETLIRSRGRRPVWLPAGFPMKLILTQKREPLIRYLYEDPTLRTYLRGRNRSIDSALMTGVTDSDFESRMEASADPHRFVATALLAEDGDLVLAAQPWAVDPSTIKVPEPRPAAGPVPELDSTHDSEGLLGAEVVLDGAAAVDGEVGTQDSLDQEAYGVPGNELIDSPIVESALLVDDAVGEASDFQGAEPEAEVGTSAPIEDFLRERNRLRSRVATLEAQLLEARSQIPSANQRRRQHKRDGRLERAEKYVATLRRDLDELGEERDRLIGIRKELEDELVEGEEAVAAAQRKSQHLERTLASDEGRAEYLRRTLEKRTSDLTAALADLPNGRERTEAKRNLENVAGLCEALDKVFPAAVATEVRTRRVTVGPTYDFAVTPIGGGTEIGGSSILIEAAGRRILVDAGMRPRGGGPREIQNVIDGDPVDALIITHAHNDHAGYVPALVSRFPRMRVICSDATQHLLPTMWADSAKVMDRAFSEAAEGETALPPSYGEAEVDAAVEVLQVLPSNRTFTVGDLYLTLFPAGHILGAVGVVIEGGGHTVVVTGDISGIDDHYLSVEPARIPEGLVAGADLLVIETTYCTTDHRPRKEQEKGLVEAVTSVVEHRGRVLIPAFGLGRAQEVVMILTQSLPEVDILVDGLAKDVTRIYETIAEDAGRSLSILGGRAQQVANRSRQLRSFTSGVIVASSGMLTGGPSVAWAKEILPDPRAAILLCGYQDEEAPGRVLQHLAEGQQQPSLRLPDEGEWVDVPIQARVYNYGLSAHADRASLIDIIERVRPQHTMLVHGFPRNQDPFRAELSRRHLPTVPTQRWSSCPS